MIRLFLDWLLADWRNTNTPPEARVVKRGDHYTVNAWFRHQVDTRTGRTRWRERSYDSFDRWIEYTGPVK